MKQIEIKAGRLCPKFLAGFVEPADRDKAEKLFSRYDYHVREWGAHYSRGPEGTTLCAVEVYASGLTTPPSVRLTKVVLCTETWPRVFLPEESKWAAAVRRLYRAILKREDSKRLKRQEQRRRRDLITQQATAAAGFDPEAGGAPRKKGYGPVYDLPGGTGTMIMRVYEGGTCQMSFNIETTSSDLAKEIIRFLRERCTQGGAA